MSAPYLILVSYDIADPRRLRRVAGALEKLGDRVQKSVFECALTPAAPKALRLRLRRLIDPAEDHILIQPICLHCRKDIGWHGKPTQAAWEPFWIIVKSTDCEAKEGDRLKNCAPQADLKMFLNESGSSCSFGGRGAFQAPQSWRQPPSLSISRPICRDIGPK